MQTTEHTVETPRELVVAGYTILFEIGAAFALAISPSYMGVSLGQIQAGVFLFNLAACVLLGISAAKLQKSWLFYGVVSAVLGPMSAAASFLMLWSHLRIVRTFGRGHDLD